MPLSQLDYFESFIDTFTILEPDNLSEYECVIICEKQYGIDGNKRVELEEQKYWYKKTPKYNIKTLLLAIQKELKTKEHPVDEMMVRILLGMSMYFKKLSAYTALNKIIECITASDLNQLCVLCLPEIGHSFNFGSFYIGPVILINLHIDVKKQNLIIFKIWR